MKNALLTSLILIGIATFAPRAEAGSYVRVFDGYDRCGRPVYVWVPQSSGHCAPSRYSYDDRCREDRYSREYYRPTYSRDRCEPAVRVYRSAPRFAFSFGF